MENSGEYLSSTKHPCRRTRMKHDNGGSTRSLTRSISETRKGQQKKHQAIVSCLARGEMRCWGNCSSGWKHRQFNGCKARARIENCFWTILGIEAWRRSCPQRAWVPGHLIGRAPRMRLFDEPRRLKHESPPRWRPEIGQSILGRPARSRYE